MTDRPDSSEPLEIYLLLPWYAAGTLAPADRARVDVALIGNPELRASLARIEEEREEDVQLNQSLPPPHSAQLDALMRRIEIEAPRRDRSLTSDGPVARLFATLASLKPRTAALAGIAAALVIVAESGAILNLISRPATTPGSYVTASVEPAAPGDQALILVAFTSGASIEAATALLRAEKAAIVDGPKAGNLFRLSVAATARDAVVADLRAHPDIIRFAGPSQ